MDNQGKIKAFYLSLRIIMKTIDLMLSKYDINFIEDSMEKFKADIEFSKESDEKKEIQKNTIDSLLGLFLRRNEQAENEEEI